MGGGQDFSRILGKKFKDGNPVTAAAQGNVDIILSFLDFFIGNLSRHQMVKQVVPENPEPLLQHHPVLSQSLYFMADLMKGLRHFLGIHRLEQIILDSQAGSSFNVFKIGIAA